VSLEGIAESRQTQPGKLHFDIDGALSTVPRALCEPVVLLHTTL
jgi:hypothetical protein